MGRAGQRFMSQTRLIALDGTSYNMQPGVLDIMTTQEGKIPSPYVSI